MVKSSGICEIDEWTNCCNVLHSAIGIWLQLSL